MHEWIRKKTATETRLMFIKKHVFLNRFHQRSIIPTSFPTLLLIKSLSLNYFFSADLVYVTLSRVYIFLCPNANTCHSFTSENLLLLNSELFAFYVIKNTTGF